MFDYLVNLKLSTKALIATIVPFLINVVWLAAMWGNSVQLQRLSVKEKQQSNFVESVNEFTQLFYQLQGAFIVASVIHTPRRVEFFDTLDARFLRALNVISNNPELLSNQKASLLELSKLAAYQTSALNTQYAKYDEEKWRGFLKFRKSFLVQLDSKLDDKRGIKELLLPQRLELDQLRLNQHRTQEAFLVLLFSGVSANLVVALLFHFAHGQYISSRVETLVANAKALSRKGKMRQPLTGRDEFCIVDAAMHQSARNIFSTFEQKQAVMQMIAQDLKSPLAASQLALELMLSRDETTLTAFSVKSIKRVTGNNLRLLALINDLLTIDVLELGHLDLDVQPEKVKRCVDEAIDMVSASLLARKVTIAVRVHDEAAVFDYRRILQVLVNLISNAIKFSEIGAEILVACEEAKDNKLKVSVTDTGKGVAEEDQKMLFQKYFQTIEGKRAAGTGLGLAISKLIINEHGERIGFESKKSKGSTFWFTLAKDKSKQHSQAEITGRK